jgi:hypothetical protein
VSSECSSISTNRWRRANAITSHPAGNTAVRAEARNCRTVVNSVNVAEGEMKEAANCYKSTPTYVNLNDTMRLFNSTSPPPACAVRIPSVERQQ